MVPQAQRSVWTGAVGVSLCFSSPSRVRAGTDLRAALSSTPDQSTTPRASLLPSPASQGLAAGGSPKSSSFSSGPRLLVAGDIARQICYNAVVRCRHAGG